MVIKYLIDRIIGKPNIEPLTYQDMINAGGEWVTFNNAPVSESTTIKWVVYTLKDGKGSLIFHNSGYDNDFSLYTQDQYGALHITLISINKKSQFYDIIKIYNEVSDVSKLQKLRV